MYNHKFLLIILLLPILIASCGGARDNAAERANRAAKGKGDIIIGAAGSWDNEDNAKVLSGIMLAAEEINSAGGALGRRIQIVNGNDDSVVNKGRLIAQNFADNLDMVAVIGHYYSYISIPASAIYEFSGLLLITPFSTSPKLTNQKFKFVFSNIPNDDLFGTKMANFAKAKGYNKVAICYVQDDYGRGLATAFEKRTFELSIKVGDCLPYNEASEYDFQEILSRWQHINFDAIFFAGMAKEAAIFIKRARNMGMDIPVIGGDGMDSPDLIKYGGKAVEGTIIASIFNPNSSRKGVRDFVNICKEKFGIIPEPSEAQGYDTLKLLAYAIEKAGSTVPEKIAETIRSTKGWIGVTGQHTFTENGDVIDKHIVKKIVRNGKFEYLEEEDEL